MYFEKQIQEFIAHLRNSNNELMLACQNFNRAVSEDEAKAYREYRQSVKELTLDDFQRMAAIGAGTLIPEAFRYPTWVVKCLVKLKPEDQRVLYYAKCQLAYGVSAVRTVALGDLNQDQCDMLFDGDRVNTIGRQRELRKSREVAVSNTQTYVPSLEGVRFNRGCFVEFDELERIYKLCRELRKRAKLGQI